MVWVLTEAEYGSLQSSIPKHQDALILRSLSGVTGDFENLSLLTCRRIGIFLCAYLYKLNHFLMIDDNIERVNLNGMESEKASGCDWDVVYDTLLAAQQDRVCLSVRTESHKESRAGELGSKIALLDMSKIRERLNLEDMFLLFPSLRDVSKWGGDYYLQLMLHAIFGQTGYGIAEKEVMTLIRAKQEQNAFVNHNRQAGDKLQQWAHPYEPLTIYGVSEEKIGWLNQTITQMNQIIHQNYQRYYDKLTKLGRVDLLRAHAAANQQPTHVLLDADVNAYASLQEAIASITFQEGVHYPHQIKAIQSIKDCGENDAAKIVMATGTGKTRVQCELARIAYHQMKKGCVIIVTPQISLMNQFYNDFIEFADKETSNLSLQIPKKAIIKISSASDSVSGKALLKNRKIKQQKSIWIVCERSFVKLKDKLSDYNPSLILLDEYHGYTSTAMSLLKGVRPLTIGLTATPPEEANEPFSKTIYQYSLQDAQKAGHLVPLLIDNYYCDYLAAYRGEGQHALRQRVMELPQVLEQRQHPQSEKAQKTHLKDKKGIVYLPSIELLKLAKQQLKKFAIFCKGIYSEKGERRNERNLQAFKDRDNGVLLACGMLREGFDDGKVSWVINMLSTVREQGLLQILGRVLRKDTSAPEKIGYIIAFKDVASKMRDLIGAQSITQLGEGYLESGPAPMVSCHMFSHRKLSIVPATLESNALPQNNNRAVRRQPPQPERKFPNRPDKRRREDDSPGSDSEEELMWRRKKPKGA